MTTIHSPVSTSPPARRPRKRPPKPARAFGYAVVVALQGTFLVLLNRSPGWDALPFLTDETPDVLPVVNASIVAALVANAVYALWDPRWLKGLGDAVTSVFSAVACLRLWSTFPFDFGDSDVDWDLVARVVLALGAIGSAIGVIVGLVVFVRELGGSD